MAPSLFAFLGLLVAACTPPSQPTTVRVAAFNVWELSREKLDQVDADGRGTHPQLVSAARVIQETRPDVLLLNEIDFDDGRENARLFVERYLAVAQDDGEPIDYPYEFFEPSNTGVPSGLDFDGSGAPGDPEDAWGFGRYPGQYAMALLSRRPIAMDRARTFRLLPWQAMPGNLMPDGTDGKPAWYSPEAAAAFRLSSKSHWAVPIELDGSELWILASHPTPPVFDGDEDRNGRRNFDEIRLWVDFLTGGVEAAYLVDDAGGRGGLAADASFVVAGDLNADPTRETAFAAHPIGQLLEHPRIQDPFASAGAAGDTSPYGRIDYVLPSHDLEVVGFGTFYPAADEPLRHLVEGDDRASDHRLVWVTVRRPHPPAPSPKTGAGEQESTDRF